MMVCDVRSYRKYLLFLVKSDILGKDALPVPVMFHI